MRYIQYICFVAVIFPLVANAETVTTTDGRIITLNNDGTYAIEASAMSAVENYLTIGDQFFERHVSQYQEESIRFIPIMTNQSDDAIVGIRFNASFRDAFGDEVFTFNGDTNERIAPGATSTSTIFYVFKNNPFISGEAYDKLLPMEAGGTGSIVTTITGIAFDGGEVLSFQ